MKTKDEDRAVPTRCCLDCFHATYICEGDSVCSEGDAFDLVLEDWAPAGGFRMDCPRWEAQ